MNRRDFLKKSAAATTLIAGSGVLLAGCERNLRSKVMIGEQAPDASIGKMVNQDGYKILYYASLAPSGHNSQPWFVRIVDPLNWVVGVDAKRRLLVVDGNNREALLSIGAFVENLVQAAGVLGYEVKITILAKNRFDADVINVKFEKSKKRENTLQRIVLRRTVKSHLQNKELNGSDVEDFFKLTDGHLHYFPVGSDHAQMMAKEAVDNFVIQLNDKKATQEMAVWTRLKDKDAIKFRDGLTPDGMEISGIAGWYVRHFMDRKDILGATYRDKGIEKVKEQVTQGGGWFVITSDGTSVKDLIESGRRFQRMALAARQKMIAIHPMTQALEEKHGQKNIKENHPPTTIPQFMLRVGYLNKYPDPVSLRRPVEWFVRG